MLQELMQDLRSHQREVDQFSDDGQTLQQLTGESRVATSISQLVSRYQTLQQTVKVLFYFYLLEIGKT